MNKNKTVTALLAILFVSLGLNGYQLLSSRQNQPGLTVLGVLDGDTVTLEGKTRFRLRNIDAPEINFCGGQEAKMALEKIIGNNKVRIEEEIIDQWGRPMGFLYIGSVLVNREMLKTGWARYHSDKTSVAVELKQIADENKKNKIGIYGPDCYQMENLGNPKCNIKGNIDPSNSAGKLYYYPGCVQYNTAIVEKDRGEQWFCTREEAEAAGFIKSSRCP